MINKNIKTGFTLIELIIVVLLGSIILLGILQVFTLNQNTSLLQKSMIETQNSGFFVSTMLTSDLQKAGISDESVSKYDVYPFNFDRTSENNDGNSQISISYMNTLNDYDCSGTAGLSTIINTYKVKDNILYCNDLELMQDVVRFKVNYGMDLNGDNFVDRYVDRNTALEMTNTDKYKIISVQFALLVSADKEYEEVSNKQFTILNNEVLKYNDGKYYRLFTKNVILKNML
jgi:prepilin-type N-terminal cleavage/methylation domain-containing protein